MSDVTAAAAGTITLGDITVNRLGLGTNRLSDSYEARALLARAVELGVNFFDTAYRYGGGASETAIGNTLAPYNGIVIATKGGWEDTPPTVLRTELEESLRRLRTDHVDVYQLHRVNSHIAIESSVAVLKQLQSEGKIRHIGLSEVSLEQLKRAREVADIVSVQNQYNVMVRQYDDVLSYCTEQRIAFIPWFPLGGLGGDAPKVVYALADMAVKYRVSAQQIALAWLLKRSPMMLPIPGTLSVVHLEENLASATVKLSDEDYNRLATLFD